ncbi:caspase family protein [Enhygromyxa salina]|uniref:Caspase domain protein n=1 Tax=Enhygromyxa salina TaxID=215803 RepID=A0A2S9YRZ9_9BACT|nr:caspase family protein [Enhygromyxa salina]PRQ07832.1 Caspase domain protein [Enhygromyxa salina]
MTRRALLIGVPGGGINVALAAQRLTPVLRELGFTTIEQRSGDRATRDGILASLDRLTRSCEPGDAVFIHYFGHGGRVRFTDHASEQVFAYVTCTKSVRGGGFEAILDVELSRRLTELDARCGNVTVMFDCCFSAELVRSGEDADVSLSSQRSEAAPDWAKHALMADAEIDLALDSHPRILRVCGASPKREAFAAVRQGRHIGRLTEAFIAAISEAGDRRDHSCWATLGHRLREHVVQALEMEGQWVALAGPVQRRLFSTQVVETPGMISFVPGDAGVGWLRAGWHQGVAVGDRWGIVDPHADDPGAAVVVELEVTSVGRNRADVTVLGEPGTELVAGMPAIVLGLRERMAVGLSEPEAKRMAALVDASPWLRRSDDTPSQRVRVEPGGVWVESAEPFPPAVFATGEPGHARALELLEDRARVAALARAWATQERSDSPLRWRWSLANDPDQPLPETGATLHAGDRIRVDLQLQADAPPFNWFVSVVLIDPAGRPRLLSTRMPEGIELAPGDAEVIGVRHGRCGAQGLELTWPAELRADLGPARLLVLASRRPIELAHIVRPQARDDDDALALQGLAGDTLRDRKPEHTHACTWLFADFHLRRKHRHEP